MVDFVLSPTFCATNKVIPLTVEGTVVTIGMVHPEQAVLIARIEKAAPSHAFLFKPMSEEQFRLKLSQLYAEEVPLHTSGEKLQDQSPLAHDSFIDRIENDAPVINLLNSLFLDALSRKASDIHIESTNDGAQVRFRIDGILLPIRMLSTDRAVAVSARLKLLSNLNVLENRRPQDGRLDINFEDIPLDVRISIIPSAEGESIVLRILNKHNVPLALDDLGFSPPQRLLINSILGVSAGLVLITGPTGSGKTTTLAAILQTLNRTNYKIISIEDPVEYRIPGITQVQTNEGLGLTFDTLLRRVFRQDPDIIMIGEIRDTETAELVVRSALTGHLVFATLHTNDTIEAVYRLQNMGLPAYLVAAVLRGIISQRLVRRTCLHCHGNGCSSCNETGYAGRTVVSEILVNNPVIAEKISKGAHMGELQTYLQQEGHIRLSEDGRAKMASGITTEEEIRRELGTEP